MTRLHRCMYKNNWIGASVFDDLGDDRVVKAYLGTLGFCVAVENFFDVCPVDRRKAHRTRLGGDVELTACEMKVRQFTGGFSYSDDLRVGGGVVVFDDFIVPCGDDFAFFDDNGAERTAVTGIDTFLGFFERTFHELLLHHVWLLNLFGSQRNRGKG